jgi:hypothetical protein
MHEPARAVLNRVAPATFRALFGNAIRCAIPWEELDGWTITLQPISGRDELATLHFPWYRRLTGDEDWHGDIFSPDPADPPVPLTVAETDAWLDRFPPARREAILRLADNYRTHRYEQTLLLAAAQLPDGRRILLDGNHKAAALWLAAVPFKLALLTVSGDPQTLGLVDLQRLSELAV